MNTAGRNDPSTTLPPQMQKSSTGNRLRPPDVSDRHKKMAPETVDRHKKMIYPTLPIHSAPPSKQAQSVQSNLNLSAERSHESVTLKPNTHNPSNAPSRRTQQQASTGTRQRPSLHESVTLKPNILDERNSRLQPAPGNGLYTSQ